MHAHILPAEEPRAGVLRVLAEGTEQPRVTRALWSVDPDDSNRPSGRFTQRSWEAAEIWVWRESPEET